LAGALIIDRVIDEASEAVYRHVKAAK